MNDQINSFLIKHFTERFEGNYEQGCMNYGNVM